jgi:hypothetical protein
VRQGSKTRPGPKSTAHREARYANYFQVGHNAFEFLIEFGQQDEAGIHTRIYMSPQHARILSTLLLDTLHQYELEFGTTRQSPNRPS